MTEQSEQDPGQARDEAALASLLQLGGARAAVPEDAKARVYAQVRSAWEATNPRPGQRRVYTKVRREWQRSGRRPRALVPLAFAASLLVALALWMRPLPETPGPATVAAHVVRSVGGADGAGTELRIGERVRTRAGEGLALRLIDGQSLRLDEDSAVTILATNRFGLEQGRLYADTGDHIYRDRELVIETPVGQVRDVGTQFAVTLSAGGLGVAVREGRVDVSHDGQTTIAVAGETLRIAGGAAPVIEQLEPYDAWWNWAATLAPAFDGADKSVLDILRWAARETGRELVFENPELLEAAMRVDLRGPVADFLPLEALDSVLETTRFRYRIEADKIVIER